MNMLSIQTNPHSNTAKTSGAIILCLICLVPRLVIAQSASIKSPREALEATVINAFVSTADGWSVDEVMLHDERRRQFVQQCRTENTTATDKEFFEMLLRVRKGGRLQVRATRNERANLEDYAIAAEITARRMADEKKVHLDQILCDPALLSRFDALAAELSPDTAPYLLRKTALHLRKARQLQPELVIQANSWQVQIHDYTLEDLTENLTQLTSRPGIYIFRDASGYLYIGQSQNLKERLTHHLKASDRDQLRRYLLENAGPDLKIELHEFAEGSPGEKLSSRRAYESELIRSRQPRLNLSP